MRDDLDPRLQERFDRELASVPSPRQWVPRGRRRTARAAPLGVGAAIVVLLAALAGGNALRSYRDGTAGGSPSVTPAPAASASPTTLPATTAPASTSPTAGSALVPHANPALGYGINTPPQYRVAASNVRGGANGVEGADVFSPRSETEDQALCVSAKDNPVGSQSEYIAYFMVSVYADTATTPVQFASAPNRRIPFTTIESVTIDGHEAARVVQQPSGDTAYYVIQANSHLYEIHPFSISQPSLGNAGGTSAAPPGWLDQIATTFRTVPFPSTSAPSAASKSLCG